MKKDSFFATRIYPILFMVVLTVIFISGVSGIYLSTKEQVELNESVFQKRAVLYAADIEYPEDDLQAIQEIYNERVVERDTKDGQASYFEVRLPSGETGYVVFTSGPGLWGEIVALFGFRNNLKTLTGVEFVEQNETPGLGARITESWFKEQFRGKSGPFTLVEEGTAAQPDELDAITGASRTSEAVLKIANSAFDVALKKVGGEE